VFHSVKPMCNFFEFVRRFHECKIIRYQKFTSAASAKLVCKLNLSREIYRMGAKKRCAQRFPLFVRNQGGKVNSTCDASLSRMQHGRPLFKKIRAVGPDSRLAIAGLKTAGTNCGSRT
jgi:hypothetical protein